MKPRPANVSQLIEALGGNGAVARITGKGPSTVSEWKRAGSIKPDYWPVLIAAAEERGLDWVTSESLMLMHTPRRELAP